MAGDGSNQGRSRGWL